MKIGLFNRIGRYEYLWDLLKINNEVSIIAKDIQYDVLVYGLLYVDEKIVDYRKGSVVVCGNASSWVKENNIVISLLENEDFLIENARVTAWGVLEILLRHSMECLSDICVDVIGYGRCGKELIKLLETLHVSYRIVVKNMDACQFECLHYEEYIKTTPNKWIIQTADSCIFDKKWVDSFGDNVCIIDITTKFVGTKSIQNEAVAILYAKALPDIYCSKSGAKAYYMAMSRMLL